MEYWNELYRDPQKRFPIDYDGWLSDYDILPGNRVLDLGCGIGANIDALLEADAKIAAADFSADAIQCVQENWGERLLRTDCFDMRQAFPYPDGSFDLVVSDLSLHYFSHVETQRIVGEIRRVLRPGGCLIARLHSVANLPPDHAEKLEENYYMVSGLPRRYFTQDEIRSLFVDWKITMLQEKQILRFRRNKQVIVFQALRL